ncbi:MAG: ABC transporter ATP-binding protein [Alphaproteobacteria bacterium]
MDALILEGVSHAYDGVTAVADVDLRVGDGELVCLLGPSGCGKTTVLRVAAGLEELQAGGVFIAGREVARPGASLAPEARGIGLVFQDYALFPHLTVVENVAFGLHAGSAAARRTKALEMLARVGMAAHAERYPHVLSGGEQQRVALARALAPMPRLLLLDEPFSGLDIRLRDRVRDETLAVLEEAGISTLIVTHDPEEAMYMADRIAVMCEGRIVQEGSPAEVYGAPADTFVTTFLSDVNLMHATSERGVVASPLGRLPAPGIADGVLVDVLIRPEALRLADGDGAVDAEVVAVHLLGHSSIVTLRLDADGRELRARLPGPVAPKPGERVKVTLDSRQAFVFPCGAPNSVE